MSAFSNMILFFASISFVICSASATYKSISQVTTEQFEAWKCASLCALKINYAFVKNICQGFYDEDIENAFNENEVESKSGCEETRVSLINPTDNTETITNVKVGICRISEEVQYCVTGSEEEDDLLIWTYKKTTIQGVLGGRVNARVCYPTSIRVGAFAEKEKKAQGSGSSSNQNA